MTSKIKSAFVGAVLSIATFASVQAAAAVPVCADYNGSWTGTCTRVGALPATTTRNVTMAMASDCSLLTVTGLGVISPGVNSFRVGKDLGRYNSDTVNPAVETHIQQGVGIQWDAVHGRVVVPQVANTVSYLVAANRNLRTISTIQMKFKVRNNGTLESESDSKIQIWDNGDKKPNAEITESCVLTPVP